MRHCPALALAALAALALAATSCTTPAIAPAPVRAGTQVNASFGRTWDAVIEDFATRTIPIRTIERASGIIVTEQMKVGESLFDAADCGKMAGGSGTLHATDVSYNVLVRGDSSKSTVKVTPRFIRTGPSRAFLNTDTVTEECSTKGVLETDMENAIKAAAEKK